MGLDLYPVNDSGQLMKGLAIGGLGIFHVFLAQFAIGGGFLMCYLQWLSLRRSNDFAELFLSSFFKFLVLVSFVVGAITGVAMWFTSIQVSPRTIGLMVTSFHWVWATEWTFFSLEVVSGYAFYRYGKHLKPRTRLILLGLYTLAAWFSLFWINGILSWQLTPGEWTRNHRVWAGFFNAGFWPSLLYRTVAAISVAALVAMVVINLIPAIERRERELLQRQVAVLLTPMILMPVLGLWYVQSMPADSRAWATGGSVAMTMFLTIAVGASAMVGIYGLVAIWYQRLYINAATSLLLVLLAFGATAGGEFVREGVRKPFTVRETLYSNSIQRDEVSELRKVGLTEHADQYPLRNANQYPTDQLKKGVIVFRSQCSVCHTLGGVNAVDGLTESWSIEQLRLNIAQLQRTKPFMPPFAGTADEVEAITQLLRWIHAGRPTAWPDKAEDNEAVVLRIEQYLLDAGSEPASSQERQRALRERSQQATRR